MKNVRGFELIHFSDDYNIDCSLQESSAVEPHIWLGVDKPKIMVMCKDFATNGIAFNCIPENKDDTGWCNIEMPNYVRIFSRMHLNQEQAKTLAKKLSFFAKHGYLKEE